jgi:hypothetical protein
VQRFAEWLQGGPAREAGQTQAPAEKAQRVMRAARARRRVARWRRCFRWGEGWLWLPAEAGKSQDCCLAYPHAQRGRWWLADVSSSSSRCPTCHHGLVVGGACGGQVAPGEHLNDEAGSGRRPTGKVVRHARAIHRYTHPRHVPNTRQHTCACQTYADTRACHTHRWASSSATGARAATADRSSRPRWADRAAARPTCCSCPWSGATP